MLQKPKSVADFPRFWGTFWTRKLRYLGAHDPYVSYIIYDYGLLLLCTTCCVLLLCHPPPRTALGGHMGCKMLKEYRLLGRPQCAKIQLRLVTKRRHVVPNTAIEHPNGRHWLLASPGLPSGHVVAPPRADLKSCKRVIKTAPRPLLRSLALPTRWPCPEPWARVPRAGLKCSKRAPKAAPRP